MGTANLLEAVRAYAGKKRPCAVVVITSDKCYENREWVHGYRETDRLGGADPYSMSKAAAELVAASWRRTFFPVDGIDAHGVRLATVRAGNVIGGGDWAADRLLPDCIAAMTEKRPIAVRNPDAVRPWQHVLEPLGGYLQLGARLMEPDPGAAAPLCEAWNFGPAVGSVWSVRRLVDRLVALWGEASWNDCSEPEAPHEAKWLALSSDKAFHLLGWEPVWDVETALVKTVAWARAWSNRTDDMRAMSERQIAEYEADAAAAGAPWAEGPLTRKPE
jgi:CDP-glucose 4,6-dehydratase